MSVTSEEEIQNILPLLNDQEIRTRMLGVKKPTPLQRIFDTIPKPPRAVPKNGLPLWYRLALDQKLSLPQIPEGMIVFARGRVGESIRDKVKASTSKHTVTFDLSDPYCRYVSYDYEPLHDLHLRSHFKMPSVKNRLKHQQFITPDGDAVCNLKEFNTNRRFLYSVYMDAVQEMMRTLDVKAKDDLTLLRVDRDVERRLKHNQMLEREQERRLKFSKNLNEELAQKQRAATLRARKQKKHLEYLAQYKEQLRVERAAKARKQEALIKQRLIAAQEMFMRKIMAIIRNWRRNEERMKERTKRMEREKKEYHDAEVLRKWNARVESQLKAMEEEASLLAMYEEHFKAAVKARMIRAFIQFYRDEQLMTAHKLKNWKNSHKNVGVTKKLIDAVASMFEKNQSGSVRLDMSECRELAKEVLLQSFTGPQSEYMNRITEIREKMIAHTNTPSPVTFTIDSALDNTIKAFTCKRMAIAARGAEQYSVNKALKIIKIKAPRSKKFFPVAEKVAKTVTIVDKAQEHTEEKHMASPTPSRYTTGSRFVKITDKRKIQFGGEVVMAGGPGGEINEDIEELKSCKDRPPTPMPSEMGLVELVFEEKIEDTLGPVPISGNMPERAKLVEVINKVAKILKKEVEVKVERGLDVILYEVTLPRTRNDLMWGDMLENLAKMILETELGISDRVIDESTNFLAKRVLRYLKACMKKKRQEEKEEAEMLKWQMKMLKRQLKEEAAAAAAGIMTSGDEEVLPQPEQQSVNEDERETVVL